MISISPFCGQVPEPKVQNAGQIPHASPGMWAISATNNPSVKLLMLCIRTLGLPLEVSETTFTESTPNLADVVEVEIRFRFAAAAWDW